jgi:hypothetical protein
MTEPIVYQLKTPVTGPNGETVTALVMKEPCAGDLIDAEATPDLAGIAILLARMSELDVDTIRRLSKRDFEAAFVAATPLLGENRKRRR